MKDTTPSRHQPKEWEKDFEKLKYRGAVDHASAVGFIRTLLHTERQAAKEEVAKTILACFDYEDDVDVVRGIAVHKLKTQHNIDL